MSKKEQLLRELEHLSKSLNNEKIWKECMKNKTNLVVDLWSYCTEKGIPEIHAIEQLEKYKNSFMQMHAKLSNTSDTNTEYISFVDGIIESTNFLMAKGQMYVKPDRKTSLYFSFYGLTRITTDTMQLLNCIEQEHGIDSLAFYDCDFTELKLPPFSNIERIGFGYKTNFDKIKEIIYDKKIIEAFKNKKRNDKRKIKNMISKMKSRNSIQNNEYLTAFNEALSSYGHNDSSSKSKSSMNSNRFNYKKGKGTCSIM